ncbi:MAG: hypoxanthine phosphoribosyltransferase [Caldilineaceae bacterium]|nr:hypoxanthine phosphoribosyltransferase [Caldilineaceae bacterium]
MPRTSGTLADDIDHILIDEETLRMRVRELGREINDFYQDQDLLLISVLKGSIMFMADLCRAIDIPHEIDFMATSSYGAGMESTGVVRIIKDLNNPIADRNILIVEDIIDSGHTLTYLLGLLDQRQPKSIRIVSLLDKPSRREVELAVDWTGFSIPNEFVVGYGLDFDEWYRNLPYIGVLKCSVYSELEDAAGS